MSESEGVMGAETVASRRFHAPPLRLGPAEALRGRAGFSQERERGKGRSVGRGGGVGREGGLVIK